MSIVQQPDSGNDYTLIVEFDDNPSGGADWYLVDLQFGAPVPALSPAGIALLVALVAGGALVVIRHALRTS